MKNLIKLTLIATIFLFSCKKETKIITEKTATLTGKIVLNCAGTPMKNREIELYLDYGWDNDNRWIKAKTDSNGNFNWSFIVKNKPYNLSIRPAGMGDILVINPSDPENLGTIIATPKCNVVMKVRVNNPYSLGDTLRLKDFPNHPTLKGINIAAPFRDTILTTAYNYSELQWPGTFEEKNTTFISTNIYI